MMRRRTSANSVCLPVLDHRRDMKGGDFSLAVVIGEDDDAAAFRIYGGVIGRGNDVFAPSTGTNGKRDEWSGVQQFSDTGNHVRILSQTRIDLKEIADAAARRSHPTTSPAPAAV